MSEAAKVCGYEWLYRGNLRRCCLPTGHGGVHGASSETPAPTTSVATSAGAMSLHPDELDLDELLAALHDYLSARRRPQPAHPFDVDPGEERARLRLRNALAEVELEDGRIFDGLLT